MREGNAGGDGLRVEGNRDAPFLVNVALGGSYTPHDEAINDDHRGALNPERAKIYEFA